MELPVFQILLKEKPLQNFFCRGFGVKENSNFVLKLELHAECMSKHVDVFYGGSGNAILEEISG